MNKGYCSHIVAAVTLSMLLVMGAGGCSTNDEQQAEAKGSIEKITDDAAEAAVKKIRTPKDKARAVQNIGDDRLEEMDNVLQKQ